MGVLIKMADYRQTQENHVEKEQILDSYRQLDQKVDEVLSRIKRRQRRKRVEDRMNGLSLRSGE